MGRLFAENKSAETTLRREQLQIPAVKQGHPPDIQSLIGIPFEQCHCVQLAALALGVPYERPGPEEDPNSWSELALFMPIVLNDPDSFYPVDQPEQGVLLLTQVFGTWHLGVFVDELRFLHVMEGKTSQLSRYTDWWKRHTEGLYRMIKVESKSRMSKLTGKLAQETVGDVLK